MATISPKTEWPKPPTPLSLAEDEVHVWRLDITSAGQDFGCLRHILSADEVTRANRFRFEKDRQLFTLARGALRILLGRYLDEAPGTLRFRYNENGKPALHYSDPPHPLRFNISHSGELVLLGFAKQRELGVDMEFTGRKSDFAGIAARFFAKEEQSVFVSLPEELQVQAFFNCWTRKEAFVKARGTGLITPLRQFEVSLRPGAPAKLRSTAYEPEDVHRWSLGDLFPGENYVAALAVEGTGWKLRCWTGDNLATNF